MDLLSLGHHVVVPIPVEPPSSHAWAEGLQEFVAFLGSVGVNAATTTTQITLHPIRMRNDELLRRAAAVRAVPGTVTAARGASDPDWVNLYTYNISNRPEPAFAAFLWLEPHTQACTWWLINAWRVGQYARWGQRAYQEDDLLVAAACTRGLLETAAALHADAIKFAQIWADCKSEHPSFEQPVPPAFSDLRSWTYEVIAAGKFDTDGAAKKAAERVKRVNVKTLIGKLAKLGYESLVEDYDWLCNVVHPSMGAMFAFSGPTFEHRPPTNVLVSFAEHPARSFPDNPLIDTTIATVVPRAAAGSLKIARQSLDVALRVIDDLGLTSGAPELAQFGYWRRTSKPGRNDPCPCRSGRKAKSCPHVWGGPAPQPLIST